MDTQPVRKSTDVGMMDGRIIGTYLSRDLLQSSKIQSWEEQPKLRHFIHYQKRIRCVRLLGSGEDGVVVLAVIKRKEYALKVVSQPGTLYRMLVGLTGRCSSNNGSLPARSSTRTSKQSTSLHLRMRAGLLLACIQ
jgi:hypothetical protein